MQLPLWAPLAADALIALTLFGFFTQGVRRGLFELTLTTIVLILAVAASFGVAYAYPYIPEIPYRFLLITALPLIAYFLVYFGLRTALRRVLDLLDDRDVPIWEALPGGLFGLARGLAVVTLVGLSLSTPFRIMGVQVNTPAPMLWSAMTPVVAPIQRPYQAWLADELAQAQAAQGQANELAALINRFVSEEALSAIFGDLGKSTIENAAKRKEQRSAADEVLGN